MGGSSRQLTYLGKERGTRYPTNTHTQKKITVRHSCVGNYAEELIHSHRDIALRDLKALAVVVLRHTEGLQIDLLPLEVVERV